MAERLTSPEEAAEMKRHVCALIDDLERAGFGRGQIGAVMTGIGLGVCAAHNGRNEALKMIDTVRLAVERGDMN